MVNRGNRPYKKKHLKGAFFYADFIVWLKHHFQ